MRHAHLAALTIAALAGSAFAKLPPLSDDAKAKAAEAAAKTAWSNKVADFQLCKAMDKVAAGYFASMKQAGKEVKPAVATPSCVDPGAFVPPGAASAPAAAPPATPAPAKKS
jgi:hypothetical protein